MRRHLASAGGGIFRRADRGEEHFLGGDAEGEAQGAVAIVGVDPILAGAQRHRGGHLHGFVSGAADLEIDAILALEQ